MMTFRDSDWSVAFDGITVAVVGRIKDTNALRKLIRALEVQEPLLECGESRPPPVIMRREDVP